MLEVSAINELTPIPMISIPADCICVKQAQYEAMLIENAKNQELFDNLVAFIDSESSSYGLIHVDPIKSMLGIVELPEETEAE